MPISIAIQFPTGRFHATPWGHHVNEGLPEWPPSPWRFLRALVATWKRKLAGEPLIEAAFPAVLAQLAEQPPHFYLPPATLGHTRHYMPWFKKGPEDKTLVFDAFVSMDPDAETVFYWPDASASPEGRSSLDVVLRSLGYLGRAESWSTARLSPEFDPGKVNCSPGPARPRSEATRVLVPEPESWNKWAYEDKKVFKPSPPWNLLAETADMYQERWSDPPGSRWIVYARPSDCFRINRRSRPSSTQQTMPTIARYALDGPVLPPVQATLPLAEAIRIALMSRYRKCKEIEQYGHLHAPNAERFRSQVLSGKNERGEPLREQHTHAFYLPSDEDSDGRLDHVTIHASAGFGSDEIRAIDTLRWLKCGNLELSLLLVGLGHEIEFRHTRVLGESTDWISATPFLVTRHLKRRGQKRDAAEFFDPDTGRVEFVKKVLQEELARRPLLAGELEIESLDHTGDHPPLRPIQFQLGRNKRGDEGKNRPRGLFRIRFAHPVAGPIAVGHSCHFGLGLFLAERSVTRREVSPGAESEA